MKQPNCPLCNMELVYLKSEWRLECPSCKRKWTGETTIPLISGRPDLPMKPIYSGIVQIANSEEN